ncbi:hypothetical protein EIP91_010482 [Steccherinum ochraceum]|uniref:NAD-dependent epimerase/dehydratase domain-containing protein n=1 Tax=Steccherinum ochraceum TaxID=92696 RepID=A0A4V2MX31_9APHY|nr:hypothetical protein EIP91_010482 [Steccherinum ochraceum]
MTPTRPLILVTGASGFIASHIVTGLLDKGYRVRGTARGTKFVALQKTFASRPDLQIIEVQDIASDDLSSAMQGVHAVIHAAAPLFGRAEPSKVLSGAIEGTMNVLRHSLSAGISKIIMISTLGTAFDPALTYPFSGGHIEQSTCGEASEQDALDPSREPLYVYVSAKIMAEKAAWDFARAHPELDLTTINPAFNFGPFAKIFPPPAKTDLATNEALYFILQGQLPPLIPPWLVDVRDVARATVAALNVAPSPNNLQRKRYMLISGGASWTDIVNLLRQKRPELQGRLCSTEGAPEFPGPIGTYDVSPAREDLGMAEYIPWETSVLEAVDSMLELEKGWGPSRGF